MAHYALFTDMNLFSVPRENFTAGGLLTPSAVTEVMPKDSQPSLDLASATSGDKIVTAQVLGNGFKYENHSNFFCNYIVTVEIMYLMSATFQENGKAADGQTTNEVLGPQRPRSNSGRELTDEVLIKVVCT